MAHLRLVKPGEPAALSYTNRKGDTYYLHEGKTKTGKPRYFFAKTVREGALCKMPTGFEVSESINAVVSVRRKRDGKPAVPDADVEVVRAAVKRNRRLLDYKVRVVGRAIVIFEPDRRRADMQGATFGLQLPQSYIDKVMKQTQYSPVMRFEQQGNDYTVFRMTYRGMGGWSYPLDDGPLPAMVSKYVRHIGTDRFFDLM